MPRRPRLVLPGTPSHLIPRGDNHLACFCTYTDYQFYLELLEKSTDKYRCQIHSYVLITNHVHLLVTPEETDSAGLMMKHLRQRYFQYINRTYRRSGTLWDSGFKSCITQDETYVFGVIVTSN
jgi:putative transposase